MSPVLSMTFLAPSRLVALVGVLALAGAYVVLQRRRRKYAVRFTNLELLDSVAPARPGWRRHLAAATVGLAMVALVVALARPVHDVQVPRETAVVMLAIDVSASMEATDVAPSRLEAAVAAASAFVDELPEGFEVGLVAFDGSATLKRAPTTDHAAVIAALGRLEVGPGTATGEGILASLDAIEEAQADTTLKAAAQTDPEPGDGPTATVVLLSDGATTVGTELSEATAAAVEAGVPVSTITFGTADGTVTVNGSTVPVPPDTASMAQVASETGGTAFEAASSEELAKVYEDIQARVGYTTEPRELTTWFVGAGAFLLLAAVTASFVWTGRFL